MEENIDWDDKDIVLLAVKHRRDALKYASKRLRDEVGEQ